MQSTGQDEVRVPIGLCSEGRSIGPRNAFFSSTLELHIILDRVLELEKFNVCTLEDEEREEEREGSSRVLTWMTRLVRSDDRNERKLLLGSEKSKHLFDLEF